MPVYGDIWGIVGNGEFVFWVCLLGVFPVGLEGIPAVCFPGYGGVIVGGTIVGVLVGVATVDFCGPGVELSAVSTTEKQIIIDIAIAL